jgi:hypothetical protein
LRIPATALLNIQNPGIKPRLIVQRGKLIWPSSIAKHSRWEEKLWEDL